jgi:hypothetical protein
MAGPGAFALAAFVGGRREPGYRARDEPISSLAAKGSSAATVMVPGFLGLAAGTLGLARALKGSTAAPNPVAAMVALAGLTTAGAGLARCSDRSCPTRWLGDLDTTRSDDLHAIFSAATFALWIATPIIAAQRAKDADEGYRTWSRRIGLSTLAVFLLGGMLARRPSQRWSGAAQRVMVAAALSWYPLAALTASRSK